jgi:uncharacterized protein YndB with AHSA1/START domain
MKQEHKLTVKQLIRADRDRVFSAWTKPELMKKWFFPKGMALVSSEADVRVGGHYRAAMSDGSHTHTVSGVYQEIEVGRKLVFSHTWEEQDPVETRVTVEFADQDGGTLVTLTHEGLRSEASRKGHEGGWLETLDSLKGYLAGDTAGAQ